jgi:hypothetical protein
MANKYDADFYLKYNNYGYSDKSLSDVKTYLANQTLPLSLNTSQKRTRFKQKWEVRSNKLVYTPPNLTVVPDGERNTVLKTIYLKTSSRVWERKLIYFTSVSVINI